MGKHERGTPKDIANRIKSKGLQKLRWYCQMCQKQCRDQNGFKCHLTSESHQRQLLLVAENTGSFLRQFSKEFEANFMQILRTCHGTKRVRANEVYQEYIKDKGHVHMNATIWHTLTGFVQYLGNSGKCKIDHNEKGWYIQYIDQEEVIRKAEEAKRAKAEKDDEERQQEMIQAQVRRALEQQGEVVEPQATELIRTDENEKITLDLNLDKKPTAADLKRPILSGVSVFDQIKTKKEEAASDEERPQSRKRDKSRERERDRDSRKEKERSGKDRDVKKERRSRSRSRSRDRDWRRSSLSGGNIPGRDSNKPSTSRREEKPKKSALDEIREQQERFKEKINRKDYWLHEGIVVKIITKKLGDDYYKAKGVVKSLMDEYTASVQLDDGTLVKLDQAHVETVIPSVGREMKIVNGAYRGCIAKLESLDQDNFCLNLRIAEGPMNGRSVQSYIMSVEGEVVKGSLKLKKGDIFKKKKKKVDPKMIDLTIKKDEKTSAAGKTKAEIAFEKRRQETISYIMSVEGEVVKGSLKLKKGDIFKKKKKKVDPKMIDLTIKKDEKTSAAGKTKAEIAFEKRRQETIFERMQKKAAVSHRERVEQFNKQMSELTEFNDIPKVSWTK
ncbi:hypothetical protein ANCCAN_07464 [Ancylostoma caninum]|uniref:DNA/RNA-binding protein Kin17 WH-like domain-containing protein n=1 Tax=Ancylostoma caninum TaxID=29170 RepID=A0A368GQ13_ANCCA|nr:hypothetical protein ANCCAN_07464 [Ancylostoma caninum]